MIDSMSDSYNEVIKRLKEYRKRINMSQSDIGLQIGLTQSHYSKIERRDKVMSNEALIKLDENGFDMDYLITGINVQKTILDELFEKCPIDYKAMFLDLMANDINIALGVCGYEQNLNYERQIKILEFRFAEKSGHTTDNIWKCIRNISGLTQDRMAYKLNIGVNTYREIEKEEIQPNVHILTLLYEKYGYYPSLVNKIKPNYLFVLNQKWMELPNKIQTQIESLLNLQMNFIVKMAKN